MEENLLKFKISKDSETGIKIMSLVEKKDMINAKQKELAIKLGFQNTMINSDDFAPKITGFANPLKEVDFKLFRKPNDYGCYIPRVSAKDIYKEINKIEIIEKEELERVVGFELDFLKRMGFTSKENKQFIFITIYENWLKFFNGNPDVQQIKMSEYYQLIEE